MHMDFNVRGGILIINLVIRPCSAANKCSKSKSMCQLSSNFVHGLGYVLVQDFRPLLALQPPDGAICIQSWVHSFTFGPVSGSHGQHRLWGILKETFLQPPGPAGRVIATFGGFTEYLE